MIAMITEKARLIPARRMAGEQEVRVKEMMSWIEENLGREVTVRDIAGAAHVCRRTCQKAFQRYLHCSPVEYLQRRRILTAAQRLVSTDNPVTDIAFHCGFSIHSYFSKSLKAVIALRWSIGRQHSRFCPNGRITPCRRTFRCGVVCFHGLTNPIQTVANSLDHSKSAPLNKEKGWRIPALFHYDSLSHFLNSSKDSLPSAHSPRFPFTTALHA